ncbi:dynein light chain [Haematococcus lacustris]|uniref:Dynein light chain n=1 Tax=Haematococcus lacustris TaxID=44745 RepID=A0A699Z5R3_HAELA|nr:dynein light chain [Haematococcus lacustris]
MAAATVEFEDLEAFLRVAKYTIVKNTDMNVEMKEEAMDICITAVEKYPNDMEKCTQMIKDQMDKKFGAPWHVVVGKGFGYEDRCAAVEDVMACGLQLGCRQAQQGSTAPGDPGLAKCRPGQGMSVSSLT